MTRIIIPHHSIVTFDDSTPCIDPSAERKPIRRFHLDRRMLERDARHTTHDLLRQLGVRR